MHFIAWYTVQLHVTLPLSKHCQTNLKGSGSFLILPHKWTTRSCSFLFAWPCKWWPSVSRDANIKFLQCFDSSQAPWRSLGMANAEAMLYWEWGVKHRCRPVAWIEKLFWKLSCCGQERQSWDYLRLCTSNPHLHTPAFNEEGKNVELDITHTCTHAHTGSMMCSRGVSWFPW